MSGFSGRQQLYERYFAGDPVRSAGFLYKGFDKDPHIDRIHTLIDDLEAGMTRSDSGPAFRLTDS